MENEVVSKASTEAMVLSGDSMQHAINFATMMAGGVATVPKHLQGSPPDCLAVTMQAMQWGMNPYSVAQKTHLVNGVLGYEAQLVNAVVSSSTAIEGRFHYEYGGDWGQNDGKSADKLRFVRVGAKLKGEDEIQWGEPLYPASVTTKNSPLWKTNEKQQSSYLGVKQWTRIYCPAVMLGVYTTDELQDMPRGEKDITDKGESAITRPTKQETEEPAIDAEIVEPVELIPVKELLGMIVHTNDLEEMETIKFKIADYDESCPDRASMVDAWKKKRARILRAQDAEALAAKGK